jgi:carnitine O-acetyltransferase
MPVRTFTMPKSLNESIANSQPPVSDVRPSAENTKQSYSDAQKEPLANHGLEKKPGITFAAQDSLAKLPIPELENTLKKYQDVLKPLQTRREHEDTIAAAQEFLKGEGQELQARLKKYATGKTSYIEQFCTSLYIFEKVTFRAKARPRLTSCFRVRFLLEL